MTNASKINTNETHRLAGHKYPKGSAYRFYESEKDGQFIIVCLD